MTETKNMSDLARLTTFAGASAKPRFMVKVSGSDETSTVFNTWNNIASAVAYAIKCEDLNPGTVFDIVDLTTGLIVDDPDAFA